MRKPILMLLAALLYGGAAAAATPQDLLRQLETQARQENAGFQGFSATRGADFFHAERTHSNGQRVSCATCHTADPRTAGKTRANKAIEPMAPAVNPQRFTEQAKIDKWFGRNCKDVLERACSAQEKGDFIQYLVNVK